MRKKKYTFIDLFAGCGGLSEGFYRMGFKALAHVEINRWACETLRTRMKYYGYKDIDKEVIEHDITSSDIIERIYNPQNEAFLHYRTSRAISQNETYRRNTPYPPLKNRPAYAGIHIL